MAENDIDFTELNFLLAGARTAPPPLSDDLQARILTDAKTIQSTLAQPLPDRAGGSVIAQLRTAIGGWPALGGLAVAGLAGVWIGVAAPSFLPDPATLIQPDAVELPGAYTMSILIEEEN